MDSTLTGVIGSGNTVNPELNTATSAAGKKRDVKGKLTFLGSATAVLIALGAVLEQGAGLGQAVSGLIGKMSPEVSEWTQDQAVVIEPDESISTLTIQICDSALKSGESMHIAFLLGSNKSDLPPAFVLKKKGCRGDTGRVWMNPQDFDKYITQSFKADFKLTYSRTHLHSLDQLVTDALNHCSAESSIEQTPGDKQS